MQLQGVRSASSLDGSRTERSHAGSQGTGIQSSMRSLHPPVLTRGTRATSEQCAQHEAMDVATKTGASARRDQHANTRIDKPPSCILLSCMACMTENQDGISRNCEHTLKDPPRRTNRFMCCCARLPTACGKEGTERHLRRMEGEFRQIAGLSEVPRRDICPSTAR